MGELNGLRVVVTRAAHQARELSELLASCGAEVISFPVIGIAPPLNEEPLRGAAQRHGDYNWIIFTSANAVRAFAVFVPEPQSCHARIAAIGDATRRAAERAGFRVQVMPDLYVAEALIGALGCEASLQGARILVPSAAVTRDVVAPALRARGAQVDVVEAYRNVVPEGAAAEAATVFREPFPDWLTFASSSAVDHLAGMVPAEILSRSKIATIGPITSETVRQYGLTVDAEASLQSSEGIVEAICRAAARARL